MTCLSRDSKQSNVCQPLLSEHAGSQKKLLCSKIMVSRPYVQIKVYFAGRVTHIHTKVHIIEEMEASVQAEYADSYVAHTGQFFFEEALLDSIYAISPYRHVLFLFPGSIERASASQAAKVSKISGSIEKGTYASMRINGHEDDFKFGPSFRTGQTPKLPSLKHMRRRSHTFSASKAFI